MVSVISSSPLHDGLIFLSASKTLSLKTPYLPKSRAVALRSPMGPPPLPVVRPMEELYPSSLVLACFFDAV